MTLLPEPQSPSRTLKGESIRSLRELFRSNIGQSASSFSVLDLEDDRRQQQQQQPQHEHEPEPDDQIERSVEEADKDSTSTRRPIIGGIALQVTSRRPSHEVRSRFFQDLGIQKQPDPSAIVVNSNTNPPPVFEPWGESYTQAINDDGTRSDGTSSCLAKENRRLQFHPIVAIHPIPSHKVYSYRIKQTIWASAAELGENVARNSLEFSYEDWDADHVLDEESGQFIYYKGEWIHPVHHFDIDDLSQRGLSRQEEVQEQEQEPSERTSDEIWKQTCERLGIQPAEYYHTIR